MSEQIPLIFVIVDFQVDFVNGSLAVPNAADTIDPIIEYGKAVIEDGGEVVLTRDWHPENHSSFVTQGGPWPPHCVQGDPGAQIHPRILEAFPDARIFSKGMDPEKEQYSGAEATSDEGTWLTDYLRERTGNVVVAGLALDFCVKETLFDLWGTGPYVDLLLPGTRPVFFEGGDLGVYTSLDHALNSLPGS
jgi:nicotinamidase/pyrazinamidase